MRLAIVCPRVPRRSELAIGPIDAEWLASLSPHHELELFVDQLTPSTDALRALGIPVKESIKRWASSEDGSYRSADSFLARSMLASHRRRPFDAVLYTSQAATDLAWLEPELATIPRGCVLGGGVCGDLRAVWQEEGLFSSFARRLWAMAGLLASADFLVGDAPLESFGFQAGRLIPARLRSRAAERVRRPEIPNRGLIVIVATTAGEADFDHLLPSAIELLGAGEDLVVGLLTSPRRPDASRLSAILDCDSRLSSQQLLVISTGDDEVAASFLEQAALVLLASSAELAVQRVAEVAEQRGALLCDGSELREDRAPVLAKEHLQRRRHEGAHVVAFHDLCSGVLAEPEALGIEADDLIVVCSGAGDLEAAVLFELGGVGGIDLVVWGQPAGLYGDADPGQLYPHALAVRAELLPSLLRAAGKADSTWDLVVWALDLDRVDRARMVVLPMKHGAETRLLPQATPLRAPWIPANGLLPTPRYVRSGAVVQPLSAPPPLLAPPRQRLRETQPSRRALEQWLRTTRWPSRLRAGLPWSWGLLERATRGDW